MLDVISRLTSCAALLSPRGPSLALRAIHLVPRLLRAASMCSRTLSDTANRSRHGSTLCSPTVEKILCRSLIVSALQISPCPLREKGWFTRGWKTAVFQKQFPFNYTKSSKVEQKYSISPLKCLQSVILKSEVSIMQCKGSTKSTVSGRFKIIVAEISGVICGVKIQVAAAATWNDTILTKLMSFFRWSRPYI